MAILYLMMGLIWSGNNYVLLKKRGREKSYGVWVHLFACLLWPVSVLYVAWGVYKKLKDM